jgi:hypothetical protein
LAWDEDVISDLALDQLGHEPIQRPSTGSDKLQNLFALILFACKHPFDGLDLAFDAADPAEHLFSILARVGQVDLSQKKVLYPPRVPVRP